MEQTSILSAVLTLALVGGAAAWDIRTRRIPNRLTFTGICLGLALGALEGGLAGLAGSALGMLAGAAFLIVPFALGGIGPGDVKLLAAVGALNGLGFVTQAFLLAAAAGGLMAGALAVAFPAAASGAVGLYVGLRPRGTSPLKQTFPYGAAILAGTVAAYAVRWFRT